jgi:hypothetical protein
MGIYRTAFISISQTEPLMARKVTVPVVALGGEKGLGAKVGEAVRMVAADVEAAVQPDLRPHPARRGGRRSYQPDPGDGRPETFLT